MPALIEHLEGRLGTIVGAWKGADETGLPRVNIAYMEGGRIENATGYASIGLSRTPLFRDDDEKPYYIEFVAGEYLQGEVADSFFPRVLEEVVNVCQKERRLIVRGEVLQVPSMITSSGRFKYLYAALPVYYDPDFKSVEVEDGSKVAIVWLVPIMEGEAKFVLDKGWDVFEQELLKHDPDLFDLTRNPIA